MTEIRIPADEALKDILAANPGAKLLLERNGEEYISDRLDGDEMVMRLRPAVPGRVTVHLSVGDTEALAMMGRKL